MPRQAVLLKKYRCGTFPVSKMSDNEDATAPLWNSEVLSVKNSVCEPIPEFPQHPEKGSKRSSTINRQDAGDVLPYQPSGPQSPSKMSELDRELTTLAIHSGSETGDAEILARCSSDQKVDCSILVNSDRSEIADVRYFGIVVLQNRRREWFDLGEANRLPSKRMPCHSGRAQSGTHVDVVHSTILPMHPQTRFVCAPCPRRSGFGDHCTFSATKNSPGPCGHPSTGCNGLRPSGITHSTAPW
jgi:hypothetical protein